MITQTRSVDSCRFVLQGNSLSRSKKHEKMANIIMQMNLVISSREALARAERCSSRSIDSLEHSTPRVENCISQSRLIFPRKIASFIRYPHLARVREQQSAFQFLCSGFGAILLAKNRLLGGNKVARRFYSLNTRRGTVKSRGMANRDLFIANSFRWYLVFIFVEL